MKFCIVSAGLIGLTAFTPILVQAQSNDYPDRPITMVVPFTAGGSSDILARAFGQSLAKQLGQSVIIENKPGAGSIIGADQVARSRNDGYTLLFGTIGSHAINLALKKQLPYDPVNSFEAIAKLHELPMLLVSSQAMSVTTFEAFAKRVKSQDQHYTFASAGPGSVSHLAGEVLRSELNAPLMHVPYKGGGAAMPDLLGGQVHSMLETIPNTLPHVRSKRLQALAITSEERLKDLPDVPTFKELGYPALSIAAWTGLFAPKGTPAPIVQRLNEAVAATAKDADYIARIEQSSTVVAAPGTPASFAAYVKEEGKRWTEISRQAGIEPE